MDQIYLDNNATTEPAPEVVEAMIQMLDTYWANPSSVHRFGQMARQRVELARASVAKLIGCKNRQIIMTGGGTESNNLALRGVLDQAAIRPQKKVLITTKIEHSAIREPAEALIERDVEVIWLDLNDHGDRNLDSLEQALGELGNTDTTVLVSIQWANNETGVIQPVARIAQLIQQKRQAVVEAKGNLVLRFHTDATQAVGKIPIDIAAINSSGNVMDLMTLSAHKFHGPKGVGALYVRPGVALGPQQRGGPQEQDRRGGTENTAGIVGMGVAAELAMQFLADPAGAKRVAALRDQLEQIVLEQLPDTTINGLAPQAPGAPCVERIWNTTNLGFARLESEAILLGLSERGVCASAGAACSSGSLEPSPVLLAMGIPEAVAHGSVRFSLSRLSTESQIQEAGKIIPQVVARLSRSLPLGT
jgi:cysteine desulfurase